MVHLCICIVTCDLCFRESVRISCLMESSVCSCDGDTMQDELRSIHHSSDWLMSCIYVVCACFFFSLCHNETKPTMFFFPSACQKMTVVVSVSQGFQQYDQQNCKYDTVVDRMTIYAYVCCTMICPMVMAVFAGSSLPLHMPA